MMIILILIEPQIVKKLGPPRGALVQRWGAGTLKLDVFGAFFGGEIKANLRYFF